MPFPLGISRPALSHLDPSAQSVAGFGFSDSGSLSLSDVSTAESIKEVVLLL